MPIVTFGDLPEPNEVTFAEGRLTTRTYASKSFTAAFGQDQGQPSRYIRRVFDEVVTDDDDDWNWTNEVVFTTRGGRKQIELQVARSAGAVRKLRIQKVPTSGDLTRLETVLELDREQSTRLIDMLRAIDAIPIEGERTVHVDDQLLRDMSADPTAMASVYAKDPERFRALIESDANASDVIAVRHRRDTAATMREWLEDDVSFAKANAAAGGPEKAWQKLLEANPWVLGIGLGGQLLISWEEGKLEQTVVGRSIKGVGKRADALLRTAGIVRSLAFAEIKHHQTSLLGEEYRSGSWGPSKEIAGAVVQVQQTVHLARQELGDYIRDQADDGQLLDTGTFLLQPRSYLIAGSLNQLTGNRGGPIPDKVRSFELFRRNLHEPELITFDELVARAEWHIETVAGSPASDELPPPGTDDPWVTGEDPRAPGMDEPPF
ncbi:Shedu immune nuclease family protein [Frankia sp. Cas3]|uniref:Shedu immune nuclease family protein n=1 Tax=Frankia sp. Cas3 TaxID=3073926 RepID=UPI002AD22518|nr:Shedu immune nuclease family protein [Frankia sp. Cas3]